METSAALAWATKINPTNPAMTVRILRPRTRDRLLLATGSPRPSVRVDTINSPSPPATKNASQHLMLSWLINRVLVNELFWIKKARLRSGRA